MSTSKLYTVKRSCGRIECYAPSSRKRGRRSAVPFAMIVYNDALGCYRLISIVNILTKGTLAECKKFARVMLKQDKNNRLAEGADAKDWVLGWMWDREKEGQTIH